MAKWQNNKQMISKKFAQELDDYIGLINLRLNDISCDIQDLALVLKDLGKELNEINSKLSKK